MKFIIYGPHYTDTSGGIIALYKLLRVINEAGHEAKFWHWTTYHPHESRAINGKIAKYFKFSPNIMLEDNSHVFTYEHATLEDVNESVVIYPEIIEGNPLGSRRVVRWLLNNPGVISGTSAFGVDELTLFFNESFVPSGWAIDPSRKLQILEWKTDVYREINTGDREGTCFMVRKGHDLPLDYHPEGAMQVDHLSHEELAVVFNRCETFISYDQFTAYTIYAALCGCDAIVVPRPDLDENAWRMAHPFGIAYGFEDLERARLTRAAMVEAILSTEDRNIEAVKNLVSVCQEFFRMAGPASA